jgi:hypothetical protein
MRYLPRWLFQPLVPRKFSLFGRDRGHFFSFVNLGRTGPRVGIRQLRLYLSSSPEAASTLLKKKFPDKTAQTFLARWTAA